MDELQSAKNAAYALVGRNLLLVQQIEYLLKELLRGSRCSGPVSKLTDIIRADAARIAKKLTMGSVVQELAETLFGSPADMEPAKEISEAHLRFEVTFESEAYRQERLISLTELVDVRNLFVHHLVANVQPDSVDSWRRLAESQGIFQSRLLKEVEYYQGLLRALRELHREHVKELQSEAVRKDFELQALLQSPFILSLGSIWYERKRADGWCLLSTAGSLLAAQVPDEYRRLSSQYGFKTLSDLISASEVFELASEADSSGKARSVFRVRPELFRALI